MVDFGSFALGLIAAIPGYVGLFITLWRGRLQFELEFFAERSTAPVESALSIRILHPTKTIEHCSVTVENKKYSVWVPLPLWSNPAVAIIQSKISKESSANFRIPKSINPIGCFIVVRDWQESDWKTNFQGHSGRQIIARFQGTGDYPATIWYSWPTPGRNILT